LDISFGLGKDFVIQQLKILNPGLGRNHCSHGLFYRFYQGIFNRSIFPDQGVASFKPPLSLGRNGLDFLAAGPNIPGQKKEHDQ
jgi:hypothetical protein